jgi:hypothetical protein
MRVQEKAIPFPKALIRSQPIRTILLESKSLGKNINLNQVNASLKELEDLYNESKSSNVLGLRLATLFERLKSLVATEQTAVVQK